MFEWYQWAVEPTSNITFPNSTTTEDDDRDDIETKIIRMITRIMFVWFIKQKNLVPDRIFDLDFLSTVLKDFDPFTSRIQYSNTRRAGTDENCICCLYTAKEVIMDRAVPAEDVGVWTNKLLE